MKFVAYYLPQFHEIKENDEWWGKGFTEWTNVKKALPLFKGHYQPQIPLNSNYYDLLNKDTVVSQTELMNKYNVYAFAYYHYWSNGKLLLEKPAENLLNWSDIDQKFFFFWANHSWIKSVNGKQHILRAQQYNGEKDWKEHFDYLLHFFKDKRYIKVNNMPVFGVYMPENIPQYNDMINCWNMWAKEAGFAGIYFIDSVNGIKHDSSLTNANAEVLRQPNLAVYDLERWYFRFVKRPSLQQLVPKYYPYKIQYSKVVDSVIQTSKNYKSNKKVYYGVYTGWDNTSRHGKRGSVHINCNPNDFDRSIHELVKLADNSQDFLFVNAWNEWAEGMYLEPDERNEYQFLEILNKYEEK